MAGEEIGCPAGWASGGGVEDEPSRGGASEGEQVESERGRAMVERMRMRRNGECMFERVKIGEKWPLTEKNLMF